MLMKHRKYRPGYEFIILYSGLILFFTGLYLKSNKYWDCASLLIFAGITFKVAFLLMFINKSRLRLQKQRVSDINKN